MFNKLLIPYDGSMASELSFAMGLELAEKYHSIIHLMIIGRLPEPTLGIESKAYLEAIRGYYKGRLAAMTRRAEAKSLKVHVDIRAGHPAEQIVRSAQEEEVDLIIMGKCGSGKSTVHGWPLGTVTERVVTYAQCAVLVVA